MGKSGTVKVGTNLGGGGTGFILNDQGHIATNYHVIEGATEVLVVFVSGKKAFEVAAKIVVTKPEKDLAILRCDLPFKIDPFTLVSRKTVGGQAVMAVGYPGVLDEVFSPSSADGVRPTGRAGEYTLNDEAVNFFTPVTFSGNVGKEMNIDSGFGGNFRGIAHNAKISEGNSGGPLIDLSGRVVGINTQVAGSDFGIDYAFAIHASELIALARAHSIPIDVTSSKASSPGGTSGLNMLLVVVVAAFAVVMFLMVLRKPRMVMVEAVSRVMHRNRSQSRPAPEPIQAPAGNRSQPPTIPTAGNGSAMHLRGRDQQGHSYDLTFGKLDFSRNGGRLVIGRNNDLCQLTLSQDSVSRQHATLTLAGSAVQVEDRNSGNGTLVNGRELKVGQPSVTLHPGDKLTVGEVVLIFEIFS